MAERLVVVGGDAGGMAAASAARRRRADLEIVALEKGRWTPRGLEAAASSHRTRLPAGRAVRAPPGPLARQAGCPGSSSRSQARPGGEDAAIDFVHRLRVVLAVKRTLGELPRAFAKSRAFIGVAVQVFDGLCQAQWIGRIDADSGLAVDDCVGQGVADGHYAGYREERRLQHRPAHRVKVRREAQHVDARIHLAHVVDEAREAHEAGIRDRLITADRGHRSLVEIIEPLRPTAGEQDLDRAGRGKDLLGVVLPVLDLLDRGADEARLPIGADRLDAALHEVDVLGVVELDPVGARERVAGQVLGDRRLVAEPLPQRTLRLAAVIRQNLYEFVIGEGMKAVYALLALRDGVVPPTANLEINALQRAATIIYQKSTREGFGLTVAEALWKGKPVIGGETGGITIQLIPGVTGFTVNSPEGAAFYTRRLLNEPELMAVLGRQGKEYARHRFLITRHLQEYLGHLIYLQQKARNG